MASLFNTHVVEWQKKVVKRSKVLSKPSKSKLKALKGSSSASKPFVAVPVSAPPPPSAAWLFDPSPALGPSLLRAYKNNASRRVRMIQTCVEEEAQREKASKAKEATDSALVAYAKEQKAARRRVLQVIRNADMKGSGGRRECHVMSGPLPSASVLLSETTKTRLRLLFADQGQVQDALASLSTPLPTDDPWVNKYLTSEQIAAHNAHVTQWQLRGRVSAVTIPAASSTSTIPAASSTSTSTRKRPKGKGWRKEKRPRGV
jgi:hypothetical protein